jgi:ornithine--oxo-acid transaminase
MLPQLSMFSVVNMGHGHPRIVSAATEAMKEAACVNIAFLNPLYGHLGKRLYEVGVSADFPLNMTF